MLWLGLCLHRLPLEVAASAPGLAVCDRLQVLHVDELARSHGVQPGMKRATALALLPGLRLVERDAAREAATLRRIACWALQFTPSVSLQPAGLAQAAGSATRPHAAADAPCGLLLEIEPSLRLFGGLEALLALLRRGLAELGFSASMGCATTATGAWLLARACDGAMVLDDDRLAAQLGALPVRLLDEAAAHQAMLESIGARTLSDLLRLPRAGLARRTSARLLVELDRALGQRAEPRIWFEAPLEFDADIELLAEVEHAQALLFAARRLLLQLAGWLAARHAAVRSFELAIVHDEREPTRLLLRLADPSRDPERLTRLLREKLEVTRLPSPAQALALRCREVVALAVPSGELFAAPASAPEELGRLIERIQARLGREQVQRMALAADHRPESAYRAEIVEDARMLAQARPAPAGAEALLGCVLPRPIWLLREPQALAERANRPYLRSALTLLAGPERIETGWWDGRLVQRDYFIAEDDAHALYWIYRERRPDADSRQGWFLHGRFG